MEMKKQKKIIGGMILVLAVTACASFFKSAAEEIAQEETSEIYQNEIKTIYTEAYQDEVETQIEEEKSSGAYTEDNMLIKENPYGTNTLSLYVYFTTQEPVSVSYNVSVPDLSIGDFSQTPEGEGRFDTEHEAAISLIARNEEFKEVHRYYRTRKENPLKKMQSVIAVACKVLRIFYTILTKGVTYDGAKMMQDIKRPQMLAA